MITKIYKGCSNANQKLTQPKGHVYYLPPLHICSLSSFLIYTIKVKPSFVLIFDYAVQHADGRESTN